MKVAYPENLSSAEIVARLFAVPENEWRQTAEKIVEQHTHEFGVYSSVACHMWTDDGYKEFLKDGHGFQGEYKDYLCPMLVVDYLVIGARIANGEAG